MAYTNKDISYVVADITNSDDITKIAKTIETDFAGQLDILVNNVGWAPVTPQHKKYLYWYIPIF